MTSSSSAPSPASCSGGAAVAGPVSSSGTARTDAVSSAVRRWARDMGSLPRARTATLAVGPDDPSPAPWPRRERLRGHDVDPGPAPLEPGSALPDLGDLGG